MGWTSKELSAMVSAIKILSAMVTAVRTALPAADSAAHLDCRYSILDAEWVNFYQNPDGSFSHTQRFLPVAGILKGVLSWCITQLFHLTNKAACNFVAIVFLLYFFVWNKWLMELHSMWHTLLIYQEHKRSQFPNTQGELNMLLCSVPSLGVTISLSTSWPLFSNSSLAQVVLLLRPPHSAWPHNAFSL